MLRHPVHPHVRGDGGAGIGVSGNRHGSPPRAWGRRHCATPLPASAAVHPHVRGDGFTSLSSAIACSGSPPRAWGRLGMIHNLYGPRRFTPTCVGTARPNAAAQTHQPVHPHVRGDGYHPSTPAGFTVGSPPRAWGRRHPFFQVFGADRFTPTCVGTATGTNLLHSAMPVHPHVRGDG